MVAGASSTQEVAVELRPGVFRPDWSAVTTPAARAALRGRTAARSSLLEKWSQPLGREEDLVWRSVLRLYASLGRAPHGAEISAETGLPEERIKGCLRSLQNRDLLDLHANGTAIRHVYPFTESETGHHVALGRHLFNALCAVDALGAGAMYQSDVAVESSCRLCGAEIHITTTMEGRALGSVSPAEAIVWYDFSYRGSAAASCCPTIAFFCSDEHLRRWLDAQSPRRNGMRLSIAEALEVGRAIFGPILNEPVSTPRTRSL